MGELACTKEEDIEILKREKAVMREQITELTAENMSLRIRIDGEFAGIRR